MRIIRGPKWFNRLLQEMICLETGREWFKDGKRAVAAEGTVLPEYPTFVTPTRTLTIAAAEGVVLLPAAVDDFARFAEYLDTKLREKYASLGLDADAVMQRMRPVRDGNTHFISVKAEMSVSGYVTHTPRGNDRVAEGYPARAYSYEISQKYSPATFNWWFVPPSQYEQFISGRDFDIAKQLVSVICDEHNLLRDLPELAHGKMLTRNLLYRDFKFWNVVLDDVRMSTMGNVEELAKQYAGVPAKDRPPMVHKIVERFNDLCRIKQSPNFITWDLGNDMYLDLSEGAKSEINNRLRARGQPHGRQVEHFDIVEVSYRSINFGLAAGNEEPIKKHLQSRRWNIVNTQVCQHCLAPIWGRAYAAPGNDNTWLAICNRCAHGYGVTKSYEHPLKFEEVLKLLPCQDPDYLEILRQVGQAKPVTVECMNYELLKLKGYVGIDNWVGFHMMWMMDFRGAKVFPYDM